MELCTWLHLCLNIAFARYAKSWFHHWLGRWLVSGWAREVVFVQYNFKCKWCHIYLSIDLSVHLRHLALIRIKDLICMRWPHGDHFRDLLCDLIHQICLQSAENESQLELRSYYIWPLGEIKPSLLGRHGWWGHHASHHGDLIQMANSIRTQQVNQRPWHSRGNKLIVNWT